MYNLMATMSPFEIACPAHIGPDRTLLFWLDRSLTLSAQPHLRFALHWLREIAPGQFGAELCKHSHSDAEVSLRATLSATFLAAVALDERGRLRLRMSKWRAGSLQVEARPGPDACSDPVLRAVFAFDSEAPARAATRLAEDIYAQAFPALAAKCAAELSRRTACGAALFDGSFDFTPEGLDAYRSALEGSAVAERLARTLDGETTIEVHLPTLDRREWPERWRALERAEAAAQEDGRIFVHTTPSPEAAKNVCQGALLLAAPLLYPQCTAFEIGFTDSRVLPAALLAQWLPRVLRPYNFGPQPWEWLGSAPAGAVVASMSLSVPGSLAGVWLRAPAERDPLFFDVYSKVSVAVQRALRRWLPYVYFTDLSRFDNRILAYPLIFYGSTYPCSGKPRSDFAYDLVGPESPGIARPWAARPLTSALARAERLLISAGRSDAARHYRSWRARKVLAGIVRHPRFLNELLTSDEFFIGRFVGLGMAARDLASRVNAGRTVKDLAVVIGEFTTVINRKLKRAYRCQEAVSLGSLLLVEATCALAAALGSQAAISATLHFSAEGREQTFVNGSRQTRAGQALTPDEAWPRAEAPSPPTAA